MTFTRPVTLRDMGLAMAILVAAAPQVAVVGVHTEDRVSATDVMLLQPLELATQLHTLHLTTNARARSACLTNAVRCLTQPMSGNTGRVRCPTLRCICVAGGQDVQEWHAELPL